MRRNKRFASAKPWRRADSLRPSKSNHPWGGVPLCGTEPKIKNYSLLTVVFRAKSRVNSERSEEFHRRNLLPPLNDKKWSEARFAAPKHQNKKHDFRRAFYFGGLEGDRTLEPHGCEPCALPAELRAHLQNKGIITQLFAFGKTFFKIFIEK